MDSVDESNLIAQAKQDPDAFGMLYRRYVLRIYNYHYRHTGNSDEAEDLTSRTFYRALRNLARYTDTGASFQAWLFRIAHNLVVNWYRDHGRQKLISIDDVLLISTNVLDPQSNVEVQEEQQRLLAVINDLPEDRRTLIILKFVERMSNQEIAAVLGKTEGAVKALYHRTLISMRQAMALPGGTDETVA